MVRSNKDWKMKYFGAHLPPAYIAALKQLVEEKKYPSIAEAIRSAIRLLLKYEEFEEE